MKKILDWIKKNVNYDGIELIAIFMGIILAVILLIIL